MAKRLQLDFGRPTAGAVEEDGQARPCAMGVGWVNSDTMATLDRLHIARTDAKGRPLAESADDDTA